MATTQSLIQSARDYTDFVSRADLDGVLSTLEPEPVFDLYPIARRMSGSSKLRRYFQYFFAEVQPRIDRFILRSELAGERGLAHEYDVFARMPRAEAVTKHRVITVVVFGSEQLAGERIYSDEKFLRLLIGPLWNALELIPAD